MGFDYLHGEPVAALKEAADPLGPTGGAALYRREAFEAVGGFDERIFLYYEDLDLALRMAAAGGRCRLAGKARALHAYSASLGPGSGEKYANTGWSRGYMLRRYGVMSQPARALRALACEAAICAGQLAMDRTAKGISGRLRGWRAGAGLERREAGGLHPAGYLDARGAAVAEAAARVAAACASKRRYPEAGAEPAAGARESPLRRRRRRSPIRSGSQRRALSLPRRVAPKRRWWRPRSEPASTAAIRGSECSGMNLTWVASRLRATSRAFSATGRRKPACQEALPTCQTTASGT